jgi:hypothetical protein
VTLSSVAASLPLWQLLQATAGALAAVAKGESANAALLRVANPLRPGVQSLLFISLRHWGRARALRGPTLSTARFGQFVVCGFGLVLGARALTL